MCAEPLTSNAANTAVDYGLYRLVTAYREHGHWKANVDVLQLKQTVLVYFFTDEFVFICFKQKIMLSMQVPSLPLDAVVLIVCFGLALVNDVNVLLNSLR